MYIGETKRPLKTRVKEHTNAIQTGNTSHSGLSEHCVLNRHSVSVDNFEVIDHESHLYKRRIKESLHIAASLNACNIKHLSVGISSAWLSLCRFL